jgi:hypothetical protein
MKKLTYWAFVLLLLLSSGMFCSCKYTEFAAKQSQRKIDNQRKAKIQQSQKEYHKAYKTHLKRQDKTTKKRIKNNSRKQDKYYRKTVKR